MAVTAVAETTVVGRDSATVNLQHEFHESEPPAILPPLLTKVTTTCTHPALQLVTLRTTACASLVGSRAVLPRTSATHWFAAANSEPGDTDANTASAVKARTAP